MKTIFKAFGTLILMLAVVAPQIIAQRIDATVSIGQAIPRTDVEIYLGAPVDRCTYVPRDDDSIECECLVYDGYDWHYEIVPNRFCTVRPGWFFYNNYWRPRERTFYLPPRRSGDRVIVRPSFPERSHFDPRAFDPRFPPATPAPQFGGRTPMMQRPSGQEPRPRPASPRKP